MLRVSKLSAVPTETAFDHTYEVSRFQKSSRVVLVKSTERQLGLIGSTTKRFIRTPLDNPGLKPSVLQPSTAHPRLVLSACRGREEQTSL